MMFTQDSLEYCRRDLCGNLYESFGVIPEIRTSSATKVLTGHSFRQVVRVKGLGRIPVCMHMHVTGIRSSNYGP